MTGNLILESAAFSRLSKSFERRTKFDVKFYFPIRYRDKDWKRFDPNPGIFITKNMNSKSDG